MSHPDTIVTYADGSVSSFNIAGEIAGTYSSGNVTSPTTQIPNINNAVEIVIGTDVTIIGDYAFYCCSGLTNVTIPDSVTSIGYSAFYQCYNLANFTFGSNVESIYGEAFYECSNLTSIVLPNSLTTIGEIAFGGCTGLQSVVFPENLVSINNEAFALCESLTSVTLPSSIEYIGHAVFFLVFDNVVSPLEEFVIHLPVNTVSDMSPSPEEWFSAEGITNHIVVICTDGDISI